MIAARLQLHIVVILSGAFCAAKDLNVSFLLNAPGACSKSETDY